MYKLPVLQPGDSVEIIAPASRCSDAILTGLENLLSSWGLNCIVDKHIFGDDLLCANKDEIRLEFLKNALQNPETKAIICARGGYGSMRLIPHLKAIPTPTFPKLFIGMSDITALNLYMQQQWHMPVIHGALNTEKFTPESINALKEILFGEVNEITFQGIPLNSGARQSRVINAEVTGGNLCLVQTSIGTTWQIDAKSKILFLEEVGERGYRIDRMLEHLHQSNLLKDVAAIVFGDFIEGSEPDGSSLVQPVLKRFAQAIETPVIQIKGVGHDAVNFPMPLGTKSHLQLGGETLLICSR